MTRRADVTKELVEMKTRPGVVEDCQTAVIEGIVELNLIGGQEVLPFEGGGDEIAGVWGQVADIADGAGAGTVGGAEGLTHEVGEVGFAGLTGGFSDLHEHGLHGSGD